MTPQRPPARCPVCQAPTPLVIAPPRHGSMLSDGAPCGVTLRRLHCRRCGVGWLPASEAAHLPRRTFGDDYTLGATLPSDADRARAQGYAARIAALYGENTPSSVLDIGCGNGALLTELARRWPQARRSGVEPASLVAAAARLGGHQVARSLRPGVRAALVVSVNVIEHTPDPLAFLLSLRRAVTHGGAAIVICPDGTLPWVELLMADHRWSLTLAALSVLAGRAGFTVARAEPAPGGFQAVLLRPSPRRSARPPRGCISPRARRGYFAAWRALDAALLERATPGRRAICFGAGEMAHLLRVQAPRSWARLTAITADPGVDAAGLGLAFLPIEQLDPDADELLLAVRPGLQPRLAARFAGQPPVLRWDDVIPR